MTDIFDRLAKSQFRNKFKLRQKEKDYITQKGIDVIRSHACDFISKRLAPKDIPNERSPCIYSPTCNCNLLPRLPV